MSDSPDTARAVPRAAFSIDEFCKSHDISRTTFFQLERDGKAPRSMKVGRRRLITTEAAAEWRARMEAETALEVLPSEATQ